MKYSEDGKNEPDSKKLANKDIRNKYPEYKETHKSRILRRWIQEYEENGTITQKKRKFVLYY